MEKLSPPFPIKVFIGILLGIILALSFLAGYYQSKVVLLERKLEQVQQER